MRFRALNWSLPLLLAAPLLLPGCGQKGELYLAEDDPERAERDARGRAEPFPFPPEGAEWPPSPPAADAPAAGDASAAEP